MPRRTRVRAEATRLLSAGVSGQVFPGGVACLGWLEAGKPVYVEAFAGKLDYVSGTPTDASSVYDLASITKPFVAMAALRLVVKGKLSLETAVESVMTDVRGSAAGSATLEQLLSHRAGLAPWGGLYLDVPHEVGTSAARRWIVGEAARRPEEATARKPLYSDLGYLIAGELIARAVGESLDHVVATEVTVPIGIGDEVFYMAALAPERRAQLMRRTAPTERCGWRGRIVRGEVHDENCAAMGGVAGNAGLFGTAHGVASFGRTMLDVLGGRADFLPSDVLTGALAPRPDTSLRLGWDQKSPEGSSAGRRMSATAFGHLGFTGTSVWCDPVRDVVVVLLTNRVHPSRANERIKGFRPAFHDGVLAAFD